MVDKRPTYALAAPQYVAQRYYFGLVGHSAPVFLVLGNHDGECLGKGRRGESGDAMPVSVSPAKTSVEYVRAYPADGESTERITGSVTHRYEITPR